MNNFSEFETRSLDLNLLNEMYNVPSKELSTNRITEILSIITGVKLDNVMTSTIFSNASLPLRERTRVTPKVTETKMPRVTKAEKVNSLLGLLGLTPVVNGEETNDGPDDEEELTEQEQQYVDEVVETQQFNKVESIYSNQNGVDVAI